MPVSHTTLLGIVKIKDEWTDGRADGRMDERTDGQIVEWMDRQLDGWTDS